MTPPEHLRALQWWNVPVVGHRYVDVECREAIGDPRSLIGREVLIDFALYRVVNVDAASAVVVSGGLLRFTAMVERRQSPRSG